MGAYAVQVPQELGRFLAGPLHMLRYFASIFIRSMAFQSEVLLASFNENCLPDDMLQCGTESKSVIVIMGPQVRGIKMDGRSSGLIEFQTYRSTNLARRHPSRYYPHSSRCSHKLRR